MTLDSIKQKWEKHEATSFPLGHRSKEVLGKSLTIWDSEIGGSVLTFLNTGGHYGARQYSMMAQARAAMPKILDELEGEAKDYFQQLADLVEEIMAIAKNPEETG